MSQVEVDPVPWHSASVQCAHYSLRRHHMELGELSEPQQ